MLIEILYFGRLRDLTGGKTTESVTLSDVDDLESLIAKLSERHGQEFLKELKAMRGLRILVNGQEHQLLSGIKTKIKDKDTVVFMPPIFGG